MAKLREKDQKITTAPRARLEHPTQFLRTSGIIPFVARQENRTMTDSPTSIIEKAIGLIPDEAFSSGMRYKIEVAIEKNLCRALNRAGRGLGWRWWREARYSTRVLRSDSPVAVSIMGASENSSRKAAINLSYVPAQYYRSIPSDAPAFAYGVLKDALELELIAAGLCEPVGGLAPSQLDYGYVIGITNVPAVLGGSITGWSENYLKGIHPSSEERLPRSTTVEGKIFRTASACNLNRIIYLHRRHHISLAADWKVSWSDLNKSDARGNGFKCLMLSALFDTQDLEYRHPKSDSTYIPFLLPQIRQEAIVRASKFLRPSRDRTVEARQTEDGMSSNICARDYISKFEVQELNERPISVRNRHPNDCRQEVLLRILPGLQAEWPAFRKLKSISLSRDQIQLAYKSLLFEFRLRHASGNSATCSALLKLNLSGAPLASFREVHHSFRAELLKSRTENLIFLKAFDRRDTFVREARFPFFDWDGAGEWSQDAVARILLVEIMSFRDELVEVLAGLTVDLS
jgi:hypothetical protein